MSSSEQQCTCCKALWVKFRLTKELTCGDRYGEALVCEIKGERQFWQGEDPDPPDPPGYPDGQGFQVWNLECPCADDGPYTFKGKEGDVGLACLDDSDPDEDRYRIVHMGCEPEVLMVKATECIKPGDTGKSAKPQRWNDSTGCWENDDMDSVSVSDPMGWLLAIPDDCFKVERDDCRQQTYRPSMPYGLTRLVKVESTINCLSPGTVRLLKRDMSDSACTIQSFNRSYRKLACDADYEYATLHIQPGECCISTPSYHGWLVPFPRPLRATATLPNGMCGVDATISGIQYRDVCQWPDSTPPETAECQVPQYACSGMKVELGWDDNACKWAAVNVQPTPHYPVLDIICDNVDCAVKKETPEMPWYVQQCEPCDATVEVALDSVQVDIPNGVTTDCGSPGDPKCDIDMKTTRYCILGCSPGEGSDIALPTVTMDVPDGMEVECSAGESVSGDSTCSADLTTTKYCTIGCAVGVGSDISLPVQPVEVVDDVYFRQDGLSLKVDHCFTTICVICVDDTNPYCETDTVEGTDCESGSGS